MDIDDLPSLSILIKMGSLSYPAPSFKGFHTSGKTIDEALACIREGIEFFLEDSQPEQHNTFVGFREIEMV